MGELHTLNGDVPFCHCLQPNKYGNFACVCGGTFSECIKQLVVVKCSVVSLYIDGLNIGNKDFLGVSSKEKRSLCLEVKQSKVKKQHK